MRSDGDVSRQFGQDGAGNSRVASCIHYARTQKSKRAQLGLQRPALLTDEDTDACIYR
jgi:hypothetical protein